MRILVTGGTSGLGFAMIEARAADGHHIVLTGRSGGRCIQAAARVGGDVSGVAMDVRDSASIAGARSQVLDLLGGRRARQQRRDRDAHRKPRLLHPLAALLGGDRGRTDP